MWTLMSQHDTATEQVFEAVKKYPLSQVKQVPFELLEEQALQLESMPAMKAIYQLNCDGTKRPSKKGTELDRIMVIVNQMLLTRSEADVGSRVASDAICGTC